MLTNRMSYINNVTHSLTLLVNEFLAYLYDLIFLLLDSNTVEDKKVRVKGYVGTTDN